MKNILYAIGGYAILDDLVIKTNWEQLYGIHSIFISGFHLHHWMIGAMLIGCALAWSVMGYGRG